MRDVNLTGWEVTPHHTYFMHLQNGKNADCVGLVVVQIGDGSEPCLGLDSHKNDNYGGHVLVVAGKPRPLVEVQYFRERQFITETITDELGRHAVRLSPGLYSYRFLVPGMETKEYEILVKPGYRVQWEEFDADGNLLDAKPRQIKFITEEVVCNWDNSDGVPFKWIDVTETAVAIATRIADAGATLRLCSFAQFCQPALIEQLQTRGLYASETNWRDLQFAAAFRNLVAVSAAKLVRLKRHDEATIQTTRNVQFDAPKGAALPSRIIAPEGTENYLALARAAAVYHASTLGGSIGNGLAIFDPMTDAKLGTSGRMPAGIAGALSQIGGTARGEAALPKNWGSIVEQRFDMGV